LSIGIYLSQFLIFWVEHLQNDTIQVIVIDGQPNEIQSQKILTNT